MENLEKKVAESLTRFYVVALFVVAMLTLSGLFLIRKTISSLNHDGRVVNLAGRQRMLSQRLTKLAILKSQNIPSQDTASFQELLFLWVSSHNQLSISGLKIEGKTIVWKSKKIDEMFLELKPVFTALQQGLEEIQGTGQYQVNDKEILNLILENETLYLSMMDKIVFQYDRESFARLKNLERIEWILDIMTILVLIAEGLLIFRPVVNATKRVVRMLTESEENLKVANQKLSASSQELVEAEKNLQKLREVQYQMQVEEDRIRASALIEGQEEERKRFAMELHDGIGQMLTGLKLQAERQQEMHFNDQKHRNRFDLLVNNIQEIIQTTRQISFNLMPSVLSDFGIQSALRVLCDQMRISSGLDITFESSKVAPVLHRNIEVGLYRIAQEALTNAVKHAEATHIRLIFSYINSKIIMIVSDDGIGFVLKRPFEASKFVLNNNGLENIRTRSRLMNGEFEILTDAKNGTKLMITINL